MRRLLSTKKGQIQTLPPAIIALVFAGVLLIFGLVILQEIRDTDVISEGVLVNDTAFLAANDTVIGLATFADFWEIIVLAVVVGIVIGLLLVVFGGRRAR